MNPEDPALMEHYRAMAAEYDSQVGGLLPDHDSFFNACISLIPDGPVFVLELGSGTGYATSRIRNQRPGAIISGIDHAPEMIRCAHSKPELADVVAYEQDIRNPWPEGTFQVIFTTLCLHHLPRSDRHPLLRRAYESLPPGGIFICGDIIRSDDPVNEAYYTREWIRGMEASGMESAFVQQMASSREMNLPEMETIPGLLEALKNAGFSRIILPYRNGISAVFAGYR